MAISYGYGTCLGCGETRAALKSGRPWPHDVAAPEGTPWGSYKRLCPGCHQPMSDIKPPGDLGRSAHLTSKTPVASRRPIGRSAPI